MATSIHDHHILELTVNAAARTIRRRTAYPERSGPNFAVVLFEGVEGYTFHGDTFGTILFDVEFVDAIGLYREYAVEMQRAYATRGGDGPWASSAAAAEALFADGQVRGYRLSSSIGLDGAVWARQLSINSD